MPFATNLYDRYNDESLAAAVFGLTLGLASLVNWLMHVHVGRAKLVREEHADLTGVFASPIAFGFTAVFLASVPLAFIEPDLALLAWISTIVLRYPLRKLTGRASSA